MKKLRTEGYVEMDLNGYITLTESEEEIAQRIYSRHQLLEKVLVAIGVDQETLREHRMERKSDHFIPTFVPTLKARERGILSRKVDNRLIHGI